MQDMLRIGKQSMKLVPVSREKKKEKKKLHRMIKYAIYTFQLVFIHIYFQ